MTQYTATMHKSICLDKYIDGDGIPTPVTFSIRKVIHGHKPWSQQGGSYTRSSGWETLAAAQAELERDFDRWASEHPEWAENEYPLALECVYEGKRHSFAYDNYSICIVTSNGDLVW